MSGCSGLTPAVVVVTEKEEEEATNLPNHGHSAGQQPRRLHPTHRAEIPLQNYAAIAQPGR
jgi:hypothetical protein